GPRCPLSRARGCLPAHRRRGSVPRALAAQRRPPAAASRPHARRSRAHSARQACGSGAAGPRAWGGSRPRETPRSPWPAPLASAARSRDALELEEVADLVLDLGAEPAEDCELDASLLSREVPTRLSEAADRPRDVAGELPVVELLGPDAEAGQLVIALEVRLDVADPAEPALGDAEAPGADEREGEVARGVVEVRELPVEDADETILVDDEVADAEVAVDDERRTPWRPVLAQPPEPELDRRVRLADLVELLHEPVDRRVLEERQPLRRQRVDLGQLLR